MAMPLVRVRVGNSSTMAAADGAVASTCTMVKPTRPVRAAANVPWAASRNSG